MRFIFNILILSIAFERLTEFSGLRGKRFPGTPKPRFVKVLPRRLDLPTDFADDWKKIGSKRKKMLRFDFEQFSPSIDVNQEVTRPTVP